MKKKKLTSIYKPVYKQINSWDLKKSIILMLCNKCGFTYNAKKGHTKKECEENKTFEIIES